MQGRDQAKNGGYPSRSALLVLLNGPRGRPPVVSGSAHQAACLTVKTTRNGWRSRGPIPSGTLAIRQEGRRDRERGPRRRLPVEAREDPAALKNVVYIRLGDRDDDRAREKDGGRVDDTDQEIERLVVHRVRPAYFLRNERITTSATLLEAAVLALPAMVRLLADAVVPNDSHPRVRLRGSQQDAERTVARIIVDERKCQSRGPSARMRERRPLYCRSPQPLAGRLAMSRRPASSTPLAATCRA